MNNKQKLLKYSGAVGALLAVAGTANAYIRPGEILLNYDPPYAPPELNFDGDGILNHNQDYVFIDIDRDGKPDFIAMMAMNSLSTSSLSPLLDNSYSGYSAFVLMGSYGYSNKYGYVGLNSYYSSDSSPARRSKLSKPPTYGFINNYAVGANIGPLAYPNDVGLLTFFSNNEPSSPSSNIPQPVPFNNFGDNGYVGVSLENNGGFNYGYIQVDIDVNSQSVEFLSCAIETNSNAPIPAGAAENVPLLPIASAAGLGLIGLMAAMKKRKKSKA